MLGLGKVAEFFVQFSVQGLPQVTGACASIGQGLAALAQAAAQAGTASAPIAAAANAVRGVGAAFAEVIAAAPKLAGMLRALGAGPVLDALAKLAKSVRELASALADVFRSAQAQAAAQQGQASGGGGLRDWAAGVGRQALALGRGISEVGLAAAIAGKSLGPLTLGLYAYATAGVLASSAGQVLSVQFAELSRQVASLFAPQVRWLIAKMTEVIRAFQQLTGAQQAGLRSWALMALAMGGVGVLLPRLVAGTQALIAAVAALRAGMAALAVAAAANPWLAGLMALAALLGVAVASTVDWRDAMEGVAKVGQDIADPFRDLLVVLRAVGEELKSMGKWAGFDVSIMNLIAPMLQAAAAVRKLAIQEREKKAAGQESGLSKTIDWGLRTLAPMLHAGWVGFGAAGKGQEGREELPPRLGGFEDVSATYKRIAEASRLVGGGEVKDSPVDQILLLLQKIETSGVELRGEPKVKIGG